MLKRHTTVQFLFLHLFGVLCLHLSVHTNQFSLYGQVDGVTPEIDFLPDVVVLHTRAGVLLHPWVDLLHVRVYVRACVRGEFACLYASA